ncbi:hypothetical protein [Pseudomonas sp. Irchel s3a10]|uniref:hypothetical protein n=1 Tax=Pseudomonas sp. Irchel s3a10 TaxID=2009045 RepID=UPI0021148C71|nr:hypothetical protein [Pseudomonas sp. Irchel s3a10]
MHQYNFASVYLPGYLHRASPGFNPSRLKENTMKNLQDVSAIPIQPLVRPRLLRGFDKGWSTPERDACWLS